MKEIDFMACISLSLTEQQYSAVIYTGQTSDKSYSSKSNGLHKLIIIINCI